jgi:hypothetical protein
VEFRNNLNENMITKDMDKTKMGLLAPKIIDTEYPKEEWLQV